MAKPPLPHCGRNQGPVNIAGNTISSMVGSHDVIVLGIYFDILAHYATIVSKTVITNLKPKSCIEPLLLLSVETLITISGNVCVVTTVYC